VTLDIIKSGHFAVGHNGRDRFGKELGRKWSNNTIPVTHLLLSVPEVCSSKKEKKIKVTFQAHFVY
jgi:hypothetical protein